MSSSIAAAALPADEVLFVSVGCALPMDGELIWLWVGEVEVEEDKASNPRTQQIVPVRVMWPIRTKRRRSRRRLIRII